MSYIPDCRTDEVYNEKNLNKEDKLILAGYDNVAENVIPTFFSNVRFEIENDPSASIYIPLLDDLEDTAMDYIESSRNEMIVSMLDGYSIEESEDSNAS